MTDEYTREALATNAARRITAAGTIAILNQIREHRLVSRTKHSSQLLRPGFTLVKRSHRIIQLETERRAIDQKSL